MPEDRIPDLAISCISSLPENVAQPFVDAVAHPSLLLKVDRRAEGVYAGIEWILPTAVVLYLSKSYFDGFLKEAGKDHYHSLKKGVAALWSTFFGKDRTVRITVSAFPPGKAAVEPKYSRALSLLATADERQRFKLLLPDTATREELEAAVGSFQDFLAVFYAEKVAELTGQELVASKAMGGLILLAYDPESGRLCVIDPSARRGPKPASEEE